MAVFCWFLGFNSELGKGWDAKHRKGRAKLAPTFHSAARCRPWRSVGMAHFGWTFGKCKFAATELTWATMTRYVGNSSLPVVLAHRRSPPEDFDVGRSFEP